MDDATAGAGSVVGAGVAEGGVGRVSGTGVAVDAAAGGAEAGNAVDAEVDDDEMLALALVGAGFEAGRNATTAMAATAIAAASAPMIIGLRFSVASPVGDAGNAGAGKSSTIVSGGSSRVAIISATGARISPVGSSSAGYGAGAGRSDSSVAKLRKSAAIWSASW